MSNKSKVIGRGGRREGAGRKKTVDRETQSFMIDRDLIEWLATFQNKSDAANAALRAYKTSIENI
jgi:hypothetical protein